MTTTPAQRAKALSTLIHDEFLDLDGLPCVECQALSGLLTGLVRMARERPGQAELIEALVAECAETLELIEPETPGRPAEPPPLPSPALRATPDGSAGTIATTASMAEHTTTTRVSLMGTGR